MIAHGKDIKVITGNSNPALAADICKELGIPPVLNFGPCLAIGRLEIVATEIAEELGLLDKVVAEGWKSLSAKETGRIGGLMTKKKKEMQAKLQKEDEERELLIEELL